MILGKFFIFVPKKYKNYVGGSENEVRSGQEGAGTQLFVDESRVMRLDKWGMIHCPGIVHTIASGAILS